MVALVGAVAHPGALRIDLSVVQVSQLSVLATMTRRNATEAATLIEDKKHSSCLEGYGPWRMGFWYNVTLRKIRFAT